MTAASAGLSAGLSGSGGGSAGGCVDEAVGEGIGDAAVEMAGDATSEIGRAALFPVEASPDIVSRRQGAVEWANARSWLPPFSLSSSEEPIVTALLSSSHRLLPTTTNELSPLRFVFHAEASASSTRARFRAAVGERSTGGPADLFPE
jgi:hypothetical protein